jgi:uncharacterized membrane protein
MVVGFVARFAYLGAESLWNDELATLGFTWSGPWQAVVAAARDTGPPLYYVLQSLLLLVVPASEFSLRLIPALAGVLSVWFTYIVGSSLYDRGVGVLGAGVMSVSFMAIYYSQEARAYSLAVLTVLLSCWALLRLLENPSTRGYAWYALSLIAAAYTHLFAAIAVAGIALGVFTRPAMVRRLGWRWIAAMGASLAAFAPWMMILADQAQRVMGYSDSGQWVLKRPESLLGELHRALSWYTPLSGHRPLITAIFIGLVLAGLGFVVAGRTRRTEPAGGTSWALDDLDRTAIMAGWVGTVFVGGLLVSRFIVPIFDPRMAIVAMPALYLLFARGLRLIWRPFAVIIIVVMLALGVPQLRIHYVESQKQNVRGATEFLLERDAKDEGIIFCTTWISGNLNRYATILGADEGFDGVGVARDWPEGQAQTVVEEAVSGRDSVYVVLSHVPTDAEGKTIVDRAMGNIPGWRLENRSDFQGIWVNYYVRD